MTVGIGLNDLDSSLRLITTLVVFVFVLAVTYVVTRWIAGYQRGQLTKGNVEVIETCRLSQTKYIQILKVGNKYLVVGICKDTMTMLTTLDEAEIKLPESTGRSSESFLEVFQRVKEWNQKKEKK